MKTMMLLMAQYEARAVVPVELVCRDYFAHLTPEKFVRKCSAGDKYENWQGLEHFFRH